MKRNTMPGTRIKCSQMKRNTLNYVGRSLFVLLVLLPALNTYAQNSGKVILFNNSWKFHEGDVEHGEGINFNDSGWKLLDLPHDWSIEGPFSRQWASGTAFLPAGIGWYRKTFTLPPDYRDKKTYIYFDGVYNNSEVWLNGHLLGKRPNGFISFQYELSAYLNAGGKNTLAVRADHTQFSDSRWYTGSGIYRNVYLITKDPLHIAQWGVACTTSGVSASKARVNVVISLVNESLKNSNITVKCKLMDGAKVIASSGKNVDLKSLDSIATDFALTATNPRLWSVSHPQLYTLIVSLAADGRETDQWLGKVGIRNFHFDADKGFSLNGENMKLKGVCLHDDAGALGVAVPKEVWRRRLKLLKEGGCNSVRMSHNPHADYFYDLCDELGLLVIDEAFDEWEVGKNKWIQGWNVGKPGNDGYHEYFKDWYDRDLGDMIRRDRNHASIIMWSIGNEIDYPNDPYSDSVLSTGRNPQIYGRGFLPDHPPAKRLGELAKLLVDVVKKYDSSRPVTAALAGVVMSNTTTFPEILDIVGYNYQEYRYNDDHKLYPKRIIYGSENGMQLSAWNAVDSNAYISGQYLWTGIDYLGEAKQWPSHGSGAGLLDMAGFPKPEYYFRQSLWSDIPMIYMGTGDIPQDAGNNSRNSAARSPRQAKPKWNYQVGEKVRVNCYTNCNEAELFLNGRSLGRKMMTDFKNKIIYWDTDYQPGKLLVEGYAKNKSKVSYKLVTTGEPYAITASAGPASKQSNGLSQLIMHVVDKNGNTVYGADNEINVEVNGPAALIGLESGNLDNDEAYHLNKRKAFNGNLLAFIQSNGKTGAIKVMIASPGLKSTTWQSNDSK